MKRRNCNLELRLFPAAYDSDHRATEEEQQQQEGSTEISPLQQYYHHHQHHHPQQPQQPITIFYEGKICVCDVTELQARSILMIANKEMEERVRTPSGSSEPSSPLVQSQHNNLHSPETSLSMKRSLQRFLQKRKNRIQDASPYTITSKTYMS